MKLFYTEHYLCPDCLYLYMVKVPLGQIFWDRKLFFRTLDVHEFEISVHEYAHKMESIYAKQSR